MNKNVSANDQLSRMKALMNYGLQTENKKTPFSELEFQKVAADGNTYAIIREGKAYYIEMAKPKKGELLKEDFNYIGGFRNRGDHKYNSYADAQKNFDLMMMSIKEAKNANDFVVESWDLDKKENVVLEASENMRKEILRERQIMNNAKSIVEKKAVCCDDVKCPQDNIKSGKPQTGDAKDAVDHEDPELPKEMNESEQVLGWNRGNDEYMDKSHGTEIGDSAPFDAAEARNIDDGDKKVANTGYMKNGVVEEGESMHDKDNQNVPTPGVGEGPSDEHNKPFDAEKGKQIDEAIDDIDDDVEDDVELGDEGADDVEFDGEDDVEDADFGDDEVDSDAELDDAEVDADDYEGDTEERLSALEELMSKIAVKLGVDDVDVDADDYDDEPLFDDEEGEDEYDLELGDEEPEEDEDFGAEDDDMPMEGRRYMRNGVEIVETRSYVNAMRKLNEEGMKPFTDAGRVPQGNMNKLDDFGKHPAYQKRVMSLPPKDLQEFPDYYDMNDDSVKNDAPYGEKIGSGDPFEIKPDAIANAISESIRKVLKKK